MKDKDKYYIVRIRGAWYFQRFETMSIHRYPDYYVIKDINQAARMTKKEAMRVAKMYGGEVIEREGELYGY